MELWVFISSAHAQSEKSIHKMAAYGKDEYYTESDFSDLSEDDMDITADNFDIEEDDDDLDLAYCICQKPNTTEMIACDNDQCDVAWFHFVCVGLTSETIPSDSWICDRCRPDDEPQAEIPSVSHPDTDRTEKEAQSESNSNPATKVKRASKRRAKKDDVGEKEPKKSSKKRVGRPPANFTEEDATQKATMYLKDGLLGMKSNPVYLANYPIALCIIALVAKLLLYVDAPEFAQFAIFLVSNIWNVATAGDKEKLGPDASAVMWRTFHGFASSGENLTKWHDFLSSLGINDKGKHVHIIYQHLLQFILEIVVKDRNSSDKPESTINDECDRISSEEEQVLRYVGGYIPYALYKRFTSLKSKLSETYCKLLSSWKVPSNSNTTTFLDYTNEWINVQNRGGLFKISDDLYLFFRTMENESRKVLTKANLDQFPGMNVKSMLFDKILAQRRIHTYWCSLTETKLQSESSKHLFDIIVKYFIKIRCKAFVKVYLDLKKAAKKPSQKKVSKKAEKALRKELTSSSQKDKVT